MAADMRSLHFLIREAREARSWTQETLAKAIGTSQAAISHFERGRPGVLSWPKIKAIADLLGIKVDAEEPAKTPRRHRVRLWFCPNPHCWSNVPCCIEGTVRYVPIMVRAAAAGRCRWCGGEIHDRCTTCHGALVPGVFCTALECGLPLVMAEEPDFGDDQTREGWCRAEAERRQRLRSMATPVDDGMPATPTEAVPSRGDREERAARQSNAMPEGRPAAARRLP